jgi:hypothetical protein
MATTTNTNVDAHCAKLTWGTLMQAYRRAVDMAPQPVVATVPRAAVATASLTPVATAQWAAAATAQLAAAATAQLAVVATAPTVVMALMVCPCPFFYFLTLSQPDL